MYRATTGMKIKAIRPLANDKGCKDLDDSLEPARENNKMERK